MELGGEERRGRGQEKEEGVKGAPNMAAPLNGSGGSETFPLHRAVWNNDFQRLEKLLEEQYAERRDPRRRTPLHLAVSLGHIESARVLLRHEADVTKENAQGWTVLHEAVSTGDLEM
ncbi:ankyrin repeat domain-containing protein 13A-like, partial [Sceloporus undulatus]|uniref:ankyrin repeat domain-containing protein 13A-like n=1 Tax=Sceloporus undulatus TaxID=8520 RepID=UPI001C4CC58B